MKNEIEGILNEFESNAGWDNCISTEDREMAINKLIFLIENKEKEAFEAGIDYYEEFDRDYNYSKKSREEGKRELFKAYKGL